MTRHRQLALIVIVQHEETPLDLVLTKIKPNCIVFVTCPQEEHEDKIPAKKHVLISRTKRTCQEIGLEDINIMVINGPKITDPLVKVARFFNGLFSIMTGKGFDVSLDLTRVDKKWILVLYVSALRQRPCITSIFMANSNEITEFWVYKELTAAEKTILEYLNEVHPSSLTPTEITEEYLLEYGQGHGSFISKILRNLNDSGLIHVKKEGRYKHIMLSKHGLSLFSSEEIKASIQTQLTIPVPDDPFSTAVSKVILNQIRRYHAQTIKEWTKFMNSTYFRISDLHEAKSLGFSENEGLNFYLCQTISSRLEVKNSKPTLEELDIALRTRILSMASQETAKKDALYHPSIARYFKASKKQRLQLLSRMLNEDARFKDILSRKNKEKK